MKNLLLLIFLIPTITFSQNKKRDLYIAYTDCFIHKIVKITNDTLTYEAYQIRFGDKIKPEIKYSVGEKGYVISNIRLSGKTYGHLSIIYNNQNSQNPTFKIDKSKIKNKVWTKYLIYARNTDFSTFFDNFKNIYLVDFNNKETDLKTAKKVKIDYIPTL